MCALLDEIASEISALSDDEIAAAAKKIAEKRLQAKNAMTPDRKEKMKEREKRRRLLNSAILKAAKEKKLVPQDA